MSRGLAEQRGTHEETDTVNINATSASSATILSLDLLVIPQLSIINFIPSATSLAYKSTRSSVIQLLLAIMATATTPSTASGAVPANVS